jgi:hypothetical protein
VEQVAEDVQLALPLDQRAGRQVGDLRAGAAQWLDGLPHLDTGELLQRLL